MIGFLKSIFNNQKDKEKIKYQIKNDNLIKKVIKERRREPRIKYKDDVIIKVYDNVIHCNSFDISYHGMGITLDSELNAAFFHVNQMVMIKLDSYKEYMHGEIKYIISNDESLCIGVHLLNPTSEHIGFVKKLENK
ncbi:hypothetical protein DEFDS_P031 (plasmid) [Deferribacter desulfuricans SSM1]|uniref:PilZ domain-containing protein n=1 Tax=Deferribacter desulfuricans (strain DSM 14783 / JCM 11476 / NBRC 101012 / SSM1) TaxID=639282 RepID=D3PEL7_DEFDS|nr:PilZ domain-containing protein [Deferribacter desulfuricans]BAI81659.1 hypothetical protein DEFDS_P031 [Deferribacter desulfuricans SSM1]